MEEQFKTIEDYPDYEISTMGTIRNIKKNRFIKTFYNNNYIKVNLYVNGVAKNLYVHRLMCLTFLPNPENKKEVNHIDGNKLNNNIKNLEWCNRVENSQHSYSIGLQRSRRGIKNEKSRKVIQMDLNGNEIKIWDCVMNIERELGIKNGAISNCCLGKSKTSANFKWKYIN